MSALDQAFIRAYTQQGVVAEPPLPLPTAIGPPVPLSEALRVHPVAVAIAEPTSVASHPTISLRDALESQPEQKAAEFTAQTASIERLFTNLARPANRSIESALPRQRSVSASETLGIGQPVYRADPGPATATVAAPATAAAAASTPAEIELPPVCNATPSVEPEVTGSEPAAALQLHAADTGAAPWLVVAQAIVDHSHLDEPMIHAPHIALAATPEAEAVAEAATEIPTEMTPNAAPAPHFGLFQGNSEQQFDEMSIAAPVEEPAAVAVASQPWRPMLQVDRLAWPKICSQLYMVAVRQMDQLADSLDTAIRQGHKVLAVGGCQAGDGATTMTICAARQLARRGLRVLVADANFANPQLATRLGLKPEAGWEDALAGRSPAEEVIIESIDDGLAVLPVVKRQSAGDFPFGMETALAASLDVLEQHYDVVLVDAGSLNQRLAAGAPSLGSFSRLGAAVVVHNLRATVSERLAEVECGLADAGVVQVGVIQNFIRS
jgi:Mrp family chromosome partitioning ATPase